MRLSEAIRRGALAKPQAFGAYFKGGRTCALGAAAEAVGLSERAVSLGCLSAQWPFVDTQQVPCPDPDCDEVSPCGCLITHLNDDHRWTREAIADWVAQVEPAEKNLAIYGPVTIRNGQIP